MEHNHKSKGQNHSIYFDYNNLYLLIVRYTLYVATNQLYNSTWFQEISYDYYKMLIQLI